MTDKYKEAGVDIDAGNRAVALMKTAVRSTFTPQVLADVGSFGGLFALENLPDQPVLVASTDGVGTKVKLAAELGQWGGIGQDIVNHCINDILVQGARPLFFLDYVASSRLIPENVAAVVTGMAEACRAAGCALLGGETAEMPGVYTEGAFDIAGTIVGVVGRNKLLPHPETMQAGDVLIGLPSSGPHTNGYSLIRKVTAHLSREEYDTTRLDETSLGKALLAPHHSYLPAIQELQAQAIPLKGMAHITGGGFIENIPRILPVHLNAEIHLGSWEVPALFDFLLESAEMAWAEAYRVFNMGIGMVLIVEPLYSESIQSLLPEAVVIGQLVEGNQTVILREGTL
jgi:phosphoribosylformylglycinamidine cyclo-ligase